MIVINKYDDQGNVVFTEMDHDGDGIIDFSYGSPYEYEFDDQGRVTRQAQYQEGSSQPGEIYTFTYHANGQLARRTSWSTDGDHRASSAWVYDATGRLLQEELDSSAGGVAQRTISYRYDTCGSLQQRRSFNIEGGEIHTEGWQHDSAGYLRRYNWEDTPLNIAGDELPELTEELYSSGFENWQYDTQGRPIRYQSQCEGNCFAYEYSIESRENLVSNREYNASGQLIRELTDLDNDGRADRVTVFEYDAGGRVTRALSDEDGDGRADTVDSYTFDKGGKLRRHETDYGADGTADSVDVVKYDSHGNVTFEESDYNSDGIPDNTSTFSHEYDAAGNHTRMEEDYDSDGIVDYVINREFDSNGRLLREETDEMADGMPESVQTYEYDAAGNLVRETQERDHTGDGVMNEATTREYSPTGWGHILDEGYP